MTWGFRNRWSDGWDPLEWWVRRSGETLKSQSPNKKAEVSCVVVSLSSLLLQRSSRAVCDIFLSLLRRRQQPWYLRWHFLFQFRFISSSWRKGLFVFWPKMWKVSSFGVLIFLVCCLFRLVSCLVLCVVGSWEDTWGNVWSVGSCSSSMFLWLGVVSVLRWY